MKIHVPAIFVIVAAVGSQVMAGEAPKPSSSADKGLTIATTATVTNQAVVARVNGSEISREELDAAVRAMRMQMARSGQQMLPEYAAQLQRNVLEEMIGRELFLQDGRKHPPADVDEKTQAQIELVKKQLGGDEQYKSRLAESGITTEEYARRVRDNVIIQETIDQLVEKQVRITADEVKSYYDKNPDQFQQPESVRASHILIRVPPGAGDDVKKEKRAQIEAARSLVKGGEKFAEVAKKVSEDPGSAPNGGDLGFFPRGAMVPEFDAAAFSLATNTVSDVITTQFGYHVLLVTDRKAARSVPFDEVKDKIGQFLKRRKGDEAIKEHVVELRKVAKIEDLLPSPPTSTLETPSAPPPTAK